MVLRCYTKKNACLRILFRERWITSVNESEKKRGLDVREAGKKEHDRNDWRG